MWHSAVDYCADAVANWLGSRAAFVQVVLVTLIWIPFVVAGIDSHGFLYLYLATALSLVTQVPLAMIGVRAGNKADQAEAKSQQTLEAILTTMKALSTVINAMKIELEEQQELLEDIRDDE